jgi:predicted DNA-binding transcriptional regulator AlpA
MPDNLMGATEIAELLGVTRQRVQQLAKMDGFPDPYDVLTMGAIWLRADIEAWARETGRLS